MTDMKTLVIASLHLALVAALQSPAAADDFTLHSFQRQQLIDVYYSEGANAGDINGDGVADAVYGPFLVCRAGLQDEARDLRTGAAGHELATRTTSFRGFTTSMATDATMSLSSAFPARRRMSTRILGRTCWRLTGRSTKCLTGCRTSRPTDEPGWR